MPNRVIIVEERELYRRGMVSLIRAIGYEVADFVCLEQAFKQLTAGDSNALLCCQLQPAKVDPFAGLEKLHHTQPSVKLIGLADNLDAAILVKTAIYGFTTIIHYHDPAEYIGTRLLASVEAGERVQLHEVARCRQLLTNLPTPLPAMGKLTRREWQTLFYLGWGCSNREVGMALNISLDTVKEHVQHLLRKMNFPDRTAAAVWAVKNNLCRLEFE